MRTGVLSVAHLSRMVLLLLLLLSHSTCAAPSAPDVQRDDQDDLANPFASGDAEKRLLRNFIHSNLKDSNGPEINTREQEVFLLFRHYDFDRSGLLDGLEMMKLLLDFNADRALGTQANMKVEALVDLLLHSHDENQDGLLAPSELLTPPLVPREADGDDGPPQEDHEGNDGQEEMHEEVRENIEAEEEEHQQEVQPEELQKAEEQDRQEIPEGQIHAQNMPVHQGQPEM